MKTSFCPPQENQATLAVFSRNTVGRDFRDYVIVELMPSAIFALSESPVVSIMWATDH